jgi:hypothetical protein
MSDFGAMGLLMGLGIVATFQFLFFERTVRELSNAIVTGVVGGVPISTKRRRLLFHRYWAMFAPGLVGYQIIIVIGWMLMARSMGTEEVRLFAYLCGFFGSIAAVGAAYYALFGYFDLRSALREAEQS